ncbi:MAG: BolA/IbaG family iron-sulfur metabolism protein [Gammaproteobacteria bacterium]|nr:BolA/IbaG family iron-sulfur metabolism protein [Gammaproteobacteria bacterium]
MTPQEIQRLIEQGLPDARVEVLSDDNTHFEALVVSDAFSGKRSLQRHQMVYRTLGEAMGREIHALSLKALAPEELTPGSEG